MPTTYTHDVFGKMVYQKLPENLKEIVEEHMNAYRIGQHGPDILFYYHLFHENPVNQKGMAMHEQIAASFFRKCKEYCQETGDEEALAYVFGFICHYMLDSTCHPYIAKYMEKTGARHDEIETELDRYLMERSGKNPFRFKPAAQLKASKESVRAVSAILELPEKTVRKSINSLKFYTGITVCHRFPKRMLLMWGMRLTGAYDSIQGHIMRKRPLRRCEQSTEELMALLRLAIPETVTVLEDFYDTLEDIQNLNGRVERNYE